jgi:ERCC4-related helicase
VRNYTEYQERYFAEQLTIKRPSNSIDSLATALTGAKVDLNPHQVDAALFAFNSPLSQGVLLADEVGLGKTIEAGIAIAQYWAEHKRKILLVVPASLRSQWLSELDEKFYIKSIILESKNFNALHKKGVMNPFENQDRVVICSYNFIAQKQREVSKINWDLVIIDEAHRLRNVYKTNNVTGNKLKAALKDKRKLLLTATPLQNNLMELYGLVSIIDDRVFSDAKAFRQKYVNVENEEIRNVFLKAKLSQFCKRTLRKQVVEYVPYTNREAMLTTYEPSPEEEKLYNAVSEYLQSDILYALPNSQRKLMTMILRKLLASSSFAISGTLDSLVDRLKKMLNGYDEELNLSDYDTFEELMEEVELSEDEVKIDIAKERSSVFAELERLREFAALAKSIKTNAKGQNLLTALEKGFNKTENLGGKRKSVIFTESRRTQEYLLNLLSNNGYEGKIVFLNGSNTDSISKRIYKEWIERHKGEDIVSGSKQADMKAAVVEEFKENACILIGTEAAAEGINLQFCSLLVNYDMPWNPQRIEQRIGRCHRYGQKNDVVVLNFVNEKNEADKRVYELLNEKFKLFDGLFGSSDEVLGSIESGVDFENRIAEIYQNCRTKEEIAMAFDILQAEYRETIDETMERAKRSLLENFDEEVSKLLKMRSADTERSVNQYGKWLYYFLLSAQNATATSLDETRIRFQYANSYKVYNLKWKDCEVRKEHFLRKEDPLIEKLLTESVSKQLNNASFTFYYTNSGRKISFLDTHDCKSGHISIERLTSRNFEDQEFMITTAILDDGYELDSNMVNRIMELPAKSNKADFDIPNDFLNKKNSNVANKLKEIADENKRFYLSECEKLDDWSEELKTGLQQELIDIDKEIKLKQKEIIPDNWSLEQILEQKEQISKLRRLREKKRRDLFEESDKIEAENERLQAEMRKRISGTTEITPIFTIKFEII